MSSNWQRQTWGTATYSTGFAPPVPNAGYAIAGYAAPTQYAQYSTSSGGGGGGGGSGGSHSTERKVFTGTVTKMHDNFGFIDDEVFFQPQVCRGPIPRVGERCLVEAQFNPNMPFKWSATRISALQDGHQERQENRGGGRVSHHDRRQQQHQHQHQHQQHQHQHQQQPHQHQHQPQQQQHRRTSRSRERKDSRRRSNDRRPVVAARKSRSPVYVAPHYVCRLPKHRLGRTSLNPSVLWEMVPNLYIPSDFFKADSSWMSSLPSDRPLSLGCETSFHVMRKDVPPLDQVTTADAPDACYLYQAKVMLLASPTLGDLINKSCRLGEQPETAIRDKQPLGQSLQFLVGTKGKGELMPIGGPWSPSLDGDEPLDPRVMIRTAIRNVKILTGLDLSKCTKWYKFVEFDYLRAESVSSSCKGGQCPAKVDVAAVSVDMFGQPYHIERVVVYVPDVWSLMPSVEEYESVRARYKAVCDGRLAEIKAILDERKAAEQAAKLAADQAQNAAADAAKAAESAVDMTEESPAAKQDSTDQPLQDNSSTAVPMDTEDAAGLAAETAAVDPAAAAEPVPAATVVAPAAATTAVAADASAEQETPTETTAASPSASAVCPTHHSKLNPTAMKVVDLKRELQARGLPTNGLKQQVMVRLQRALEMEAEKEKEQEQPAADTADSGAATAAASDAARAADEKKEPAKDKEVSVEQKKPEKLPEPGQLERWYKLPEKPHLVVHPSKTAKAGRFDCCLRSLASLLEPSGQHNKEHSFEVAVFAQLFNEMLYRDQSLVLSRSLCRRYESRMREEKLAEAERAKRQAEEAERKRLAEEEAKRQQAEQAADAVAKTEPVDEGTDVKNVAGDQELLDEGLVVQEEVTEEDSEEPEAKKAKLSSAEREGRGRDRDERGSTSKRLSKEKERDVKPAAKQKMVGLLGKTLAHFSATVTHDKSLLLACSFFDQNLTDHIQDRDLEQIVGFSGLELTRAQIKTVLSKVLQHGRLEYRPLADRPAPADVPEVSSSPTEEGQVTEEEAPEAKPAAASQADASAEAEAVPWLSRVFDDTSEPAYMGFISNGNKPLLKKAADFAETVKTSTAADNDGVVCYRGLTIDVGATLGSLERSERLTQTLKYELRTLQETHEHQQKEMSRLTEKHGKANDELVEARKKLDEQRDKTRKYRLGCDRLRDVITLAKDKMNYGIQKMTTVVDDIYSKAKPDEPAEAAAGPPDQKQTLFNGQPETGSLSGSAPTDLAATDAAVTDAAPADPSGSADNAAGQGQTSA